LASFSENGERDFFEDDAIDVDRGAVALTGAMDQIQPRTNNHKQLGSRGLHGLRSGPSIDNDTAIHSCFMSKEFDTRGLGSGPSALAKLSDALENLNIPQPKRPSKLTRDRVALKILKPRLDIASSSEEDDACSESSSISVIPQTHKHEQCRINLDSDAAVIPPVAAEVDLPLESLAIIKGRAPAELISELGK